MLRLRDTVCSLIFMKNIYLSFSVQEPQHITVLCVPFNQYSINSYVQRTKVSGDDKVRDFWRHILSSERMAGTTFQHLWVILNLLEGGSEQLCRCVPGEASDKRFYPKPMWFSTDQATKSRRISKMVSHLSENSSSRPVPVFVEFKYSVIYGKMFFQQEEHLTNTLQKTHSVVQHQKSLATSAR